MSCARSSARVVGSREAQFCVGQAKGCQVELHAVLEHLHAIDEAGGPVRLRRKARPPPSTSRLPLRAFEGSKVGVIGVERAGPARRATWRRLRGRRGGGRDSRLRADPLDLAEEPAKLPVADDRQRARRKARPCGQEVHLKLCGPRPAADAAVNVREAQIVARGPVPAQDQVVADHIHR